MDLKGKVRGERRKEGMRREEMEDEGLKLWEQLKDIKKRSEGKSPLTTALVSNESSASSEDT